MIKFELYKLKIFLSHIGFKIIFFLKQKKYKKIKKHCSWAEKILLEMPISSKMISKECAKIILLKLESTLKNNIDGDIVELGCNKWRTSLLIAKLLKDYASDKKFHVYDSFNGLPEKSHNDIAKKPNLIFKEWSCKTNLDYFKFNFNFAHQKIPIIHIGWFKEIPDCDYPEKISFAFFDGDFYSSIYDSFTKVYDRLTTWWIICIHDYNSVNLPGVKQACDDFLKDKPERITSMDNIELGLLIKN